MSESNRNSGGGASQPQHVRHIPIFVEGRDKPLLNTISPSNSAKDSAEFFDDSLKSMGRTFGTAPSTGSSSSNSFPIHTQSKTTNSSSSCNSNSKSNIHQDYDTVDAGNVNYTPQNHQQQQNQQSQNQQEEEDTAATAPPDGPPPKSETTIEKIQSIQRDVHNLMDRVEQYKCQSKRDREYVYLDEMLTQHLLKLDTIDSDGNEIIKKARREAIRCINKCIETLEAKAEAAKLGGANGPNTNLTNNSIENSISSQTAIT